MAKKNLFLTAATIFLCAGGLQAQMELLGSLTPEEILRQIPEWKPDVDAYAPNLEVIGKLQGLHEEVRVDLFIGTWCPDCRRHVSAYIKIMNMVQNPMIRTTYTGVPRAKEARQEYVAGRSIERLPTFIVIFRNREIGRIIETPRRSVEEDLWAILETALGDR